MGARAPVRLFVCAFLGAALVLALSLASFGRSWWCACGYFNLVSLDPWSSHSSQHLIDFYSPSHFLHGVVLFWALTLMRLPLRFAFMSTLAIEVGWEIAENSDFIIQRYRSVTASLGYFGDSIVNSLSDLSMCAVGFFFAARFSWRLSVYIFLVLEAATTMLIRDGLVLNVIMLLYPIDAIRIWQSALGSN